MHVDEMEIYIHLVRELLEAQFPQWALLPIKLVNSGGTDNEIFRLGEDMVIRLPRITSAVPSIDKEFLWLQQLAPHLSLAIPTPLARGVPGEHYPWPWVIYQWIEGKNAMVARINDLAQAAIDLGHFILELQQIDISNVPISQRGRPLNTYDHVVRDAIKSLHGIIDVDRAIFAWQTALAAPVWNGKSVWIHGDLHPLNVLVRKRKICAIIDFGMAGLGDPACDMMVAWTLLDVETRELLRNTVKADDAMWARGRGWALMFGLVALPYYLDSNLVLADVARRTIHEILST